MGGGRGSEVFLVLSVSPLTGTESFVQLENRGFSPGWCPMRLGSEEKLKGWTEEGAARLCRLCRLCRLFCSCHGSSSAVIPPKCLPGEAFPSLLPRVKTSFPSNGTSQEDQLQRVPMDHRHGCTKFCCAVLTNSGNKVLRNARLPSFCTS